MHARMLLPMAFALGFVHVTPQARTWVVRANGSGDVPTLQAAIDVVAGGDTILVASGTYTWTNQGTSSDFGMIHIPRGTNDFVLRSQAGAATTILDAQRIGRIMFISGWNNLVIEGFTFRNGEAPLFGDFVGGAIAAHLTFDTIKDCVFTGNNAARGGAIWCGGVSGMQIIDCEFNGNTAERGAGLYFINSPDGPTLRGCLIRDNVSINQGGGVYATNNPVSIFNSLFLSNSADQSGGGFQSNGSTNSVMTSCTFVGNSAATGSSLGLLSCTGFSLVNSILAGGGPGPAFALTTSTLSVSCTDVFGHPGGDGFPAGVTDAGGNFSLAPLFCDASSSDYSLRADSPCADGNHPGAVACGTIGAFGVGCGLVPVEVRSLGELKALYRIQ